MGLSLGTVIVCGWWANRSSVADKCVCVCPSYQPACPDYEGMRREKDRGTAPPALCLTSAPVIWYTTDSPSEYACTVSHQTAGPLSSPARPAFHVHHFSGWTAWTCQELRQLLKKWQSLRCTSNVFPKNSIKLLTHPASLAVFIRVRRRQCEAIS